MLKDRKFVTKKVIEIMARMAVKPTQKQKNVIAEQLLKKVATK